MKTRFHIAAIALLATFALAFSLHAQDAMKALEIKAAKKPKSDKWSFSLLPVGLQKNPQVDYTFMTEMTDDGRKLPEPSVSKPVYYISHSMGQHDVGDPYGGTKEIKYQFLEKQLNTALASAGYQPADDQHPATQLLIFFWGMHNKIEPVDDGTGDSSDTSDSTDDGSGDTSSIGGSGDYSVNSDDIMNLLSRAKAIGGTKFANEFARALSDQMDWGGSPDPNANGPLRNFAQRDETTEALVDEIFNECYYVIVTSYDVDALKHNVKKPLWTTHITTGSQGISFEQTLPIMINQGAWFFGRETKVPEVVTKRAYKNATVEIGEPTVIEYMSTGTAAKPAPKPATKPAPKSANKPSTTGTTSGKP